MAENEWTQYQGMFDNFDALDKGLDGLVDEGIFNLKEAGEILDTLNDAKDAPIQHIKDMAKVRLNTMITNALAMRRGGATGMSKLRSYLDENPGATSKDYVADKARIGKRLLFEDWGLTKDQLRMYGRALGIEEE